MAMDTKPTTVQFPMGISTFIPNLIPKLLRNCATFTMKEGDAQQQNDVHHALKNVSVNAEDGSCGFHIGKICTQ